MSTEEPPSYSNADEAASARMAARLAAEARYSDSRPAPTRTAADAHQSAVPDHFAAADKLPFYRIVNSDLLPKVSKSQAVKTLDILHTVIGNILDPPDPRKSAMYRQLRLSNTQISKNIVDVSGALEFLYEAKFKKETVEFTPYLVFPPSPSPAALHKLRVAKFVLSDLLARAKAEEEREARYKASEKEAEQVRAQKALLAFEEDRRLKRERDERARVVREAKAARGEADTSIPSLAHPSRPRPQQQQQQQQSPQGQRRATTRRRAGNNGDEPPPAYGAVQGRVLGTGEPPEPVLSNVSQQDLEPSDGEDADEREAENEEEDEEFRSS